MASCTDQPPQGFIGDFLIGERLIGDVKYLDAICGTPVCGQAICGMWWAYSCAGGLGLGASIPDLIVNEVPSAALYLSAYAPELDIDSALQVPDAPLVLRGVAPALAISSSLPTPAAGLRLGAYVPDFAGQAWLHEHDCTTLALTEAGVIELTLAAAPVTSIDLEPEVCR